jgi:serralysin
LEGNTIRHNQGSEGGGIGINAGNPISVRSNRIYGNEASYQGGGLRVSYNDADLVNNYVTGNKGGTGAGLYARGSSLMLKHNTFVRNLGGDGVGLAIAQDSRVAMTNTIVVSQTVGVSVVPGAVAGDGASLESTLWGQGVWANLTDWAGDVDVGTINVWGDPGFVDPDGDDYHIGPGSAAVDAGVDAGVRVDSDSEVRPMGGGFDIGADEFWPAATATPTATPTAIPTATPTRDKVSERVYLPVVTME